MRVDPAGWVQSMALSNPSVAGGSAAAVECVFHEAAHVLDATLVRWVEEESTRQGVDRRPTWGTRSFSLDAHWRPYLDGNLRSIALRELVDSITPGARLRDMGDPER